MPSLQVLLFARYAELLGTERLDMPVPDPATVAGVVDRLRSRPGGDRLPARLLVAVNARQAGQGTPVGPGDEVAVLPPMAGG